MWTRDCEARERTPGRRLTWQSWPKKIPFKLYLRRKKRVSQINLAVITGPHTNIYISDHLFLWGFFKKSVFGGR